MHTSFVTSKNFSTAVEATMVGRIHDSIEMGQQSSPNNWTKLQSIFCYEHRMHFYLNYKLILISQQRGLLRLPE